MNNVMFTSCKNGDDIIISLSCDENSRFGVEGYTIIRTPKFEFMFDPTERGAHTDWDEDDVLTLVDEVTISRNELEIKTRGKVEQHLFNLRKIEDE